MVEYAIRVPSLEVQNLTRCSRTNPLLPAASQYESVLKASGKSQGFHLENLSVITSGDYSTCTAVISRDET